MLIIYQHQYFLISNLFKFYFKIKIFVFFSYKVSSETVQLVFLPIRIYYRLIRLIYGKNLNPFKDIKEGLHPIALFYKTNQLYLRILIKIPYYFIGIFISFILIKYFICK